jgi:hypothetical protein
MLCWPKSRADSANLATEGPSEPGFEWVRTCAVPYGIRSVFSLLPGNALTCRFLGLERGDSIPHSSNLILRTWGLGAGRRWGRVLDGAGRLLPLVPLAIPGRCGGRRFFGCWSAGRAG